MRAFPLVAVALVLPLAGLSGCSTAQDLSLTGLFRIPALAVGDPAPLPVQDCTALLDDLKGRLLTETRIALDRSLADRLGMSSRPSAPVSDVFVDEVAFSSADTASAAPAMESARASSGSGSASAHTHNLHSGGSAGLATGTNNQEVGVDEGDLVKTDGEWTYILDAGTLHVIHSKSLGDLEERSTLALGHGGAGELLLLPRGPGQADDRLVAILAGQPTTVAEAGIAASAGASSRRPSHGDGDEELRSWHGPSTRIVLIGLADRAKPTIEKDLMVEGAATASRLVGDHVYVVVSAPQQSLNLGRWVSYIPEDVSSSGVSEAIFRKLGSEEKAGVYRQEAARIDAQNERRLSSAQLSHFMPVIREGATADDPGGLVAAAGADCDRVLTTPGLGRGITTIAAIAAGEEEATTELRQVVGSAAIVYASPDALVMAAPTQDLWLLAAQSEVAADVQATTDVTWFSLDGLKVDPVGSGRVVGLLQDQFSLDVKGTELRVASTVGAVADLQATWGGGRATASISTQVATFSAASGHLVPTGLLTGIAPGERIWSARFTDDRAYLVTFPDPVRVILRDPLWVIDLSGPVPKVLGELEIPGVSTYIHPLSDDALLSIGYGPGPNDNGLDRDRIQLSLFDISDTSRPKRTSVLDLSPQDGRSWSGAVAEHKAFNYWPEAGLLAVPVTTVTEAPRDDPQDVRQHIGVTLVDVDEEAMRLEVRGQIEQEGLVGDGGARWGIQVLRTYFQGFPAVGVASVVSISELGVTSHDLRDLRQQDAVPFKAWDGT